MKPVILILVLFLTPPVLGQSPTRIEVLVEDFSLEGFPAPPSSVDQAGDDLLFDPPLLPNSSFTENGLQESSPLLFEAENGEPYPPGQFWESVFSLILTARPYGEVGAGTAWGDVILGVGEFSWGSLTWSYNQNYRVHLRQGNQGFFWEAGIVQPFDLPSGTLFLRTAGGQNPSSSVIRAGGLLSYSWEGFWFYGGGDWEKRPPDPSLGYSPQVGLAWRGPVGLEAGWSPVGHPLLLTWGEKNDHFVKVSGGDKEYRWAAKGFLRSDKEKGAFSPVLGMEVQGDVLVSEVFSLGLIASQTGKETQVHFEVDAYQIQGGLEWSSSNNWVLSLEVRL